MDKRKPSKDGRGNVRYLWVLVGAYLVYLAYEQAQLLLHAEVTTPKDVAVCVISGVMFAAVGVWVVYREWEAWRYLQAHKDDPDAWDDASEDDEDAAPKLRRASDRDAAPELRDASDRDDGDAGEDDEASEENDEEDADEASEEDEDGDEEDADEESEEDEDEEDDDPDENDDEEDEP